MQTEIQTMPDAAQLAGPVPFDALRARLAGTLLEPGDPAYDEARLVFQRAVDGHPAAIVRPTNALDVAAAVAFAVEHGLRLRVKAGGHSIGGYSTGDGLLIDLAEMNRFQIDAERRIARVEAGVKAIELSDAASALGLAVPFGDAGTVGIAGLTLGGGIGYLARKYGLAIDSLRSVELVTSRGEIVRAAADENPDLFWAVRGGGGNFGVATSFEFELREVGTPYAGALVLPATRDVLRSLATLSANAPEELTVIHNILHAPPMPFLPPEAVGSLVVVILGVYVGDPEAGARAWAPFRALATPLADLVGPMPYSAIYRFTPEEQPVPLSFRSLFLDAFDDDAVDAVLASMQEATSPAAIVQLRILGGAMSRVDADATAFAQRDARMMVAEIVPHVGPASADAHRAWTDALYEALRTYGTGVYVNFLGDEGDARIREAYPGTTYDRLAEVKAAWDPENVFSANQNIRPAVVVGR